MMPANGFGVFDMLTHMDWSEKWIWGLVAFHIFCGLFTLIGLIKKNQGFQIFLFLSYLSLIYFSENINKFAAENYKYISKYQYFDDRGMFISILFSTPLLIYASVIVIMWMVDTIYLMINMKRTSLLQKSVKKTD